MNSKYPCLFLALALLAFSTLNSQLSTVFAQGTTAFTYQGQLSDGGTNANGAYTMIFKLYDAVTDGNLVGVPITNHPTLANGLFSINLDFGTGAFAGGARWLDITVSEGGTTQELSPRVPVLPAPYAQFAAVAGTVTNGAITTAQIAAGGVTASNLASGQVVKSLNGLHDAVTLSAGANITFTTNGSNLTVAGTGGGGGGNARLATNVVYGISITNAFITNSIFAGNGSQLTSLNAANLATGTVPGAQLAGAYGNAVTFNNAANRFSGGFSGNGSGLTNVNAATWNGLTTNLLASLGGAQLAGTYTNAVTFTNPANHFGGNGSALKNLNASQLALGYVPQAALVGPYTNVLTFLNPANSFAGDGTGLTNVDAVTLNGSSSSNFVTLAANPKTGIHDEIQPDLYFSGSVEFGTNVFFYDYAEFWTNTGFFGEAEFHTNVFFYDYAEFWTNVLFIGEADFRTNATFYGEAQFATNADFFGEVGFHTNVVFVGTTIFGTNAIFLDQATFNSNAVFSDAVNFGSNVVFSGATIFTNTPAAFYSAASFLTNAYFSGETWFSGETYFRTNVAFIGEALFLTNVIFDQTAGFVTNVAFAGPAVFGTNAEFRESILFPVGGDVTPFAIAVGDVTAFGDDYPDSLVVSNGPAWQVAIAQYGAVDPYDPSFPAGMAVNGSLGVEVGNLGVKSGNIFIDAGNLNVEVGDINVNSGDVNVTGDVYANNLKYKAVHAGKATAAAKASSATALSRQAVLDQVAKLPISTWSSNNDPNTTHVGPNAHDFQTTFGLGQDGKTISLVDESGVALAAIQGLNEKLKDKDAQIAALEKRLSDLEQLVKASVQK